MQFSWLTALWKGLRDAFLSAIPAGAAAILVVVFGAVSPEQLAAYGVPFYFVPLLVGLFTYVRNFLRNRFGWPI
jgi:hypothetical protein